jgi:hypothetical protein
MIVEKILIMNMIIIFFDLVSLKYLIETRDMK